MDEIDADREGSRTGRPSKARWGLSRRAAVWLVLMVLVGAGAYLIFENSGVAQQRGKRGDWNHHSGPTPVVAAAATSADVNIYLNGLGTVTPLNTVTVRSRVDGQLVRVLFREGQLVKPGELLAEIDPRPFEVQLAQAEGQLARDQALLANARMDLERYKTLLGQDSIAKQQVDTQAALVRQYEGTVKTDRGQVENARLQLSYARITSPISGRLGLRQVDTGNIVHASDSTGLVIITQLQPITVVFSIPEGDLPAVMKRLRAGEPPQAEAFDRDGKVKLASGVLLTVDNQIDPGTGTVKLKAQFPNEDHALFPNQFVNVRLHVDTRAGATVMPAAAVQQGTPGTFIYVVDREGEGADGKASVRTVKLGPADGENVAVESGLKPGELVVVDGGDRLREGAEVQLVSRDAGATPATKAQPSEDGKRGGERKGRRSRKDGT